LQRRVIETCLILLKTKPSYQSITAICDLLAPKTSKAQSASGELHLPGGLRLMVTATELLLSFPLERGQQRGSSETPPPYRLLVEEPGRYPLPGLDMILQIEMVDRYPSQPEGKEGTILLNPQLVPFPLLFRPALPGERFRPAKSPGKKVYRYYNEKALAAHLRSRWPVLEVDGRIAAIVGLGVAESFGAREGRGPFLQIVWKTA
jgi:tRNA(Ile)-lysidine synthetase-like protein